ncbi:uncharacterized protein N7511_008418 [Penicillium nucicola]|uniref:uncharacterized protein n=1 Tax=Penicillium nucicola TaxID=1850975 RepID=UPI0025454880|nr:uncharacterized protein N7511_008418 [Penicillium nucicola]KAJ5751453.1 hypothetical protein N7511_008418 [Penicillium nucicola]
MTVLVVVRDRRSIAWAVLTQISFVAMRNVRCELMIYSPVCSQPLELCADASVDAEFDMALKVCGVMDATTNLNVA